MNKDFYASIPTQRFLIWLTIVLMTIFGFSIFALMGFVPPPPANWSAQQVAEFYQANPVRFRIGAVLGMISGGSVLPLCIVISVQMARLEKGIPIWAIVQGITGAMGTFFFWLPMLMFATAAFTVDRPPEVLLLMHEFGWLTFITPLSLFPLQLLGIVIICFSKDEPDSHSAFPRWVGYVNVWTLITSFGGPIAVLFKEGIFAWNGLLPFWIPVILFSIWLPAMSFTCLRALRFQQQNGQALVAGGA